MKTMKQTDITSAVMSQIKHGEVRMRPRIYFTLLTIASVAVVTFTAIIIAYLSSIVFFWIRIQTADTMAWGARANLSEAIESFPWWALVVALALLVAVVYLIRRHGRMYRHKTSTIILVILAASLLLGFGLSLTGIDSPHSSNESLHPQQRGNGLQR